MSDFLSKNYWDSRYQNQEIGWDIGAVSAPLKAYFDQLTDPNLRVLIPGGGNSYEAVYLLEKGFKNVTVVDFSETVTDSLRQKHLLLNVVCEDFFQHQGDYDLIVEQTFFCALDPSLRTQYAPKMQQLLSENGKLVGLFFDRIFVGGPPFGGSEAEYRVLLQPYFDIKIFEKATNSIPPRAGSELFLIARQKTLKN